MTRAISCLPTQLPFPFPSPPILFSVPLSLFTTLLPYFLLPPTLSHIHTVLSLGWLGNIQSILVVLLCKLILSLQGILGEMNHHFVSYFALNIHHSHRRQHGSQAWIQIPIPSHNNELVFDLQEGQFSYFKMCWRESDNIMQSLAYEMHFIFCKYAFAQRPRIAWALN